MLQIRDASPHISSFSPIRFPEELSLISPAEDDRTEFAQEEQLDLPLLDHDLGHLCFGGRIQISGHSDFGIL